PGPAFTRALRVSAPLASLPSALYALAADALGRSASSSACHISLTSCPFAGAPANQTTRTVPVPSSCAAAIAPAPAPPRPRNFVVWASYETVSVRPLTGVDATSGWSNQALPGGRSGGGNRVPQAAMASSSAPAASARQMLLPSPCGWTVLPRSVCRAEASPTGPPSQGRHARLPDPSSRPMVGCCRESSQH